ncbi:MAG TPA: hypothetical protein VMS16_11690, partial [Mycobacterium sp.]|nr:hypothetical protein [Mycobacterium sp.]
LRLVGGRWPGDGHPWKLSNDDAMLFVESGELQLFLGEDVVDGKAPTIGVTTTEKGQRYLRVEGGDPDELHRLPHCSPEADED